ncbi:MAG TPA: J domain-containing protein [bacterium]|nr:J domain-containing protein [bacterium]
MPKKDYYQTLGVSRNAPQDEIKKAYKKLARKYHPDCNPGDKTCENKFKDLSEAYSALSHPDKRKEYDLFGPGGPGRAPDPGAWGGPPGGGRTYTWSSGGGPDFNLEDIFGGRGGGMGDIFSEMFGGRGRRGGRRVDFSGGPFQAEYDVGPQPGRDLEAELSVSFDDAMEGGVRKFSIGRNGVCPSCGGTGKNAAGKSRTCAACNGAGKKQVANTGANFTVVCSACGGVGRIYTEPCPACAGAGSVARTETVTVKVPAGVKDGGRLRIPGKGEPGPGGAMGDLVLRISVAPHPFFRRDGDDLHLDVPVTVSEAGLGAKIEVPTLTGKATLKVPAGTQNGAMLRLRGKGAPRPKGGGSGDLYVHIQVKAPTDMDEKTRKLLEELKKHETDPRKGKF